MKPLVSVLLCHNRLRHMVPMAIESYLSQDWPNLELVVVDDGPEPIQDLVMKVPRHCYIKFPAENLSQKRNVGVRQAEGEFIVHFDADDWSGPHRVTDQVEALLSRPAARVTGYDRAYWFDFVKNEASFYRGVVWSATLAYHRSWALENGWDETKAFLEDGPFIQKAQRDNVLMAAGGGNNFVATMHDRNARRSAGQTANWPIVPYDQLPEGFKKSVCQITPA